MSLTPPVAHGPVSLAALGAGKDVCVEKPLAVSLSEARNVMDVAGLHGRLVGRAPDAFAHAVEDLVPDCSRIDCAAGYEFRRIR